MLFVPIRYINNGEPLDQVTLNRYGFDVQENLEEIISRLSTVEGSENGSVVEIPHTLALRDANGTTQFAPPIVGTNPMRLMDFTTAATAGKGVVRNQNGTASFSAPTQNDHPIRLGDVQNILSGVTPKTLNKNTTNTTDSDGHTHQLDLSGFGILVDWHIGTKGFLLFSNGITIQWGSDSSGTGNQGGRYTFSFQRPMTTLHYADIKTGSTTGTATSTSNNSGVYVRVNRTDTGFGTVYARWFLIGTS